MDRKKDIRLGSKIEFSTPTPESFDGKKKQFLMDDEAGMWEEPTYWPSTNRCLYCGRFLKKGLGLWGIIQHWDKCPPYQKKRDKAIEDGLLGLGWDLNLTGRYIAGIDPYKDDAVPSGFYMPNSMSHPIKQFVIIDDYPSMMSKPKRSRKGLFHWLKKKLNIKIR